MHYQKIYQKQGGWVCIFFLFLAFNLLPKSVCAKEKPSFTLTQSAQQVWQRQQVLITLTLITKDPFARLEAEEFQQKGWQIVAYPMQRKAVGEGEKQETQLSLRWAAFPFMTGKQLINLPEVLYRPNRGRKQLLALQAVAVQVRALPVYVPPTMPVGKITLQSLWQNGFLINTGELNDWHINVLGEKLAGQTMPPLKRQLVSSDALQILPVNVSSEVKRTAQGINIQRDYHIPFKTTRSGRVDFPEITVQFFEPDNGKLQKAVLKPPLLISLNRGLFWGGLLFAVALFLFVLFKLVVFLLNRIRHHVRLKRAMTLLNKAENYLQLRSAINQLAIVEGWGTGLLPSRFLQKWQKKYGPSAQLEKKISRLQTRYFSDFQETDENI